MAVSRTPILMLWVEAAEEDKVEMVLWAAPPVETLLQAVGHLPQAAEACLVALLQLAEAEVQPGPLPEVTETH